MIDITLNLSETNSHNAQLNGIINIMAIQKAGFETMIELLAVDRKEAVELMGKFDKKCNLYANRYFEKIYETWGEVDINEILKNEHK